MSNISNHDTMPTVTQTAPLVFNREPVIAGFSPSQNLVQAFLEDLQPAVTEDLSGVCGVILKNTIELAIDLSKQGLGAGLTFVGGKDTVTFRTPRIGYRMPVSNNDPETRASQWSERGGFRLGLIATLAEKPHYEADRSKTLINLLTPQNTKMSVLASTTDNNYRELYSVTAQEILTYGLASGRRGDRGDANQVLGLVDAAKKSFFPPKQK